MPLASCDDSRPDPDPVPTNQAPSADAGSNQAVRTSSQVTLDGSRSRDLNGDSLKYRWSLTARPFGSVAVLAGADSAHPTFTADVAGDYIASLTVNDGKLDSTNTATVTVTCTPTYALRGLNFSPYVDGQNPNLGATVGGAQITARLDIVRRYTRAIRTFGSSSGLEAIPALAKAAGLEVVAGAWISANTAANDVELTNLVANAASCKALLVGSEVLLRGDISEDALLAYIARVKAAAPSTPVGYADTYATLLAHPRVLAAVDVIYANFYPYWEGIGIDRAAAAIQNQYTQLVAAAGRKPVVVGETGWPSAGNTIGSAFASAENAATFFLNFVSWAEAKNVEYFYFEALNENWKTTEGPQGIHWGLWTADGLLKPGMQPVFDGNRSADTWTPSLEITHVPAYGSTEDLTGRVLYLVDPSQYKIVVYINVAGGWWIKPYASSPVTNIVSDGNWTTDVTTGTAGDDPHATQIAVYLETASYSPPILLGSIGLPNELAINSVTSQIITRAPT
jgi:exo-beta-1,3-glucanase (GH17 family)